MTTVFGKIIKGEIPCELLFENERIIAFKDIRPIAPVHILIVPKKEIASLQEMKEEDTPLLGEVLWVAAQLAKKLNLVNGYRVLTNSGLDSGQEVLHLHFHLIGGRRLGPLG